MNQRDQMREQEHYLLNRLRQNYAWLIRDGFTTSANNLDEAITEITKLSERVRELEQALAHVNETPKNEHDSADVLKRAVVRLTEYELIGLMYDTNALPECEPTQKELIEFANAIMDAFLQKNGLDK